MGRFWMSGLMRRGLEGCRYPVSEVEDNAEKDFSRLVWITTRLRNE